MKIFRAIEKKMPRNNEHFLFVVHLTRTIEPYLVEWIKNFKTIGVISIPYSENKTTKHTISKYTSVYEVSDFRKIPGLIKVLCQENSEKKIVLVEIGGYSSKISHTLKNVILSIEDTNQGYWDFKKHEKNLSYPVVSIANTALKGLENRLVGQSVVFSTERILRDYFNQGCLTTQDVLVLSYGQIGRSVCNALRGRFSRIYVYDIDPVRLIEAYLDGYNIVNKVNALPYMDIIIGVSGSNSIVMPDVTHIKDKTLLVSGSSKQVEFPYKELELYKKDFQDDSIIEEFEVLKGKSIYVAFKGQPINFIDDSAFGDTFEIIMSGFMQCARFGLNNKLTNGVYDLPDEYQKEVANLYHHEKLHNFPKKNIEQHKAATGYLVNYDKSSEQWRILMIDHAKIKKLLPIGGHVEKSEDINEALTREVLEETGLNIKVYWDREKNAWAKKCNVYTVQIEEIPAHKDKKAHIHEDYMYVGYVDYCPVGKLKTQEKNDLKWRNIPEIIDKVSEENIFPEVFKTLVNINELEPPKNI